MNFIKQLSAMALLVGFLFGVACGAFAGASHGSRREDRKKDPAPGGGKCRQRRRERSTGSTPAATTGTFGVVGQTAVGGHVP